MPLPNIKIQKRRPDGSKAEITIVVKDIVSDLDEKERTEMLLEAEMKGNSVGSKVRVHFSNF